MFLKDFRSQILKTKLATNGQNTLNGEWRANASDKVVNFYVCSILNADREK